MNRFYFYLAGGWMLLTGVCSAAIVATNLRCEYLTNPLGIDSGQPRLSWVLDSSRRGENQSAYQILVASSAKLLADHTGDLWDSGKVSSDDSVQIVYAGKPLESRESCFWQVRAWDRDGKPGPWSPVAHWQMGLLNPGDWQAKWISAGAFTGATNNQLIIHRATYEAVAKGGSADVTAALADRVKDNQLKVMVNNQTLGVDPARDLVKRLRVEYEYAGRTNVVVIAENHSLVLPWQLEAVPYLRRSFALRAPVQKATLYATALGLYDAHINGQRVGDHVFAPDWTDYRQRVRYQAYDVTKLLNQGGNALTVMLANGWFSGHIGNGGFEFFGKTPAFLAQLEVTYQDGHTETIVTDGSWKSHPSPITSSDFMLGEDYDARLAIKNWDRPGLDETGWNPVTVRHEPPRELDAQVSEPVRELCELKPKAISEPQPGHWVYDLGQNMVGVVRLKVSAPGGTEVTLRHAEMLNPDGTIYTKNLRGAPSIDHYICRGTGPEIWQPRFTFHGFRYVEVSGLPYRPDKSAVTGVVIGSDTPRTGEFSCSDPRLNQLQSNIQWGQRGNYLSVPTDCPQRDERLGWMGDAQVFIRTATYNADVAAFFTKWMVDVDDGQSPAGAYGDVSPNTMRGRGSPAWADAGVICPWRIYEAYGDKRILERHLPAMTRWVEFCRTHSHDLIRDGDRGSDFGDWLSINADTPKDLIGTAYFAYSTHLLARSYAALGRAAEAKQYEDLFEAIKAAFNQQYVAPDGRIKGDTQCAYAMALKFDLLPAAMRIKAAQYLKEDIQAKGWHLSTGFIGVGYLLPVLTQTGNADVAYRLLLQDTFPSWLFSVKHGATTIWERWDGWTPDKGFQDPGMNSFNHYSLGSCGEYLFGDIGGIQPASPGYSTILIKPVIGDGLTWAKTCYDSIRGPISTYWKKDGAKLRLDVTIPVNTTATVFIPKPSESAKVTESGKDIAGAPDVTVVRQEPDYLVVAVASGSYHFKSE
jgi:alpha-L-rhamnosidase